ncbi:hypothetical protein [Paenarthrobacter ilicis]|uniref:GerMN domain-containing protein n=2 Tax=Paenarthrobacter ilicis TaxID=43665 RepID=A0ABX0TJA9_9MICC|nr:hypothetical protein [Paenarthrobacter ilicis]MBM7795008.1 hypothetical protein [Paenarthrobacter ilicis]NIJ02639.1 hypothetical protein [Paenarthrobacter ilicis]
MATLKHPKAVIAVVLLLATLLSGCSFGPNDSKAHRTTTAAGADLNRIPGVKVRMGRAYDGFTPYLSLNVELGEEFVGGEDALLDSLLAHVWSQDEVSPKDYVTLRVTGPGRTPALTATALSKININAFEYTKTSLSLKGSDLHARYGEWPGPVPSRSPSVQNSEVP